MVQIQVVCNEMILIYLCHSDFLHLCSSAFSTKFVETSLFSSSMTFFFIINLFDNIQLIYCTYTSVISFIITLKAYSLIWQKWK